MFDQRKGDSPGFSTGTAGACDEDCVSCTIQASFYDMYTVRQSSTKSDVHCHALIFVFRKGY